MDHYIYTGRFAGQKLTFSFRHPETGAYFGDFLKKTENAAHEEIVRVPSTDCMQWKQESGRRNSDMQDSGIQDNGYWEYSLSVSRASDVLLHSGRIVIHAAAIRWRNRAILFSADSGTGKSTHISHWIRLFGDEAEIMNGDKPILKREEDGEFTVWPSPWKGKERWGNDSLHVPLGAIILLQQGKENRMLRQEPGRIAPLLLTQFFSMFETEEAIHLLCRMEDEILQSVPVWKLINNGEEASAVLAREILLQEERKNA